MTQHETKQLLCDAASDIELLIYESDLLQLATEQAEAFDEKTFDRLILLAETFKSSFDCHTENIQYHLDKLIKSLPE